MLANAAKVAAVICARIHTVMRATSFRRLIIRGVTVREAVRHEEINHIFLRQPLEFSELHRARGYRQFKRSCACWSSDAAYGGARFCVGPDLQPNEQIVASRGGLRAF